MSSPFWTRWLLTFAHWILKKMKHDVLVFSTQTLEVLDAIRPHLERLDASTTIPGEAKRHQVYAAAIKRFPEVSKSVIGLAIEMGIHQLRFKA